MFQATTNSESAMAFKLADLTARVKAWSDDHKRSHAQVKRDIALMTPVWEERTKAYLAQQQATHEANSLAMLTRAIEAVEKLKAARKAGLGPRPES